MKQKLLIIIGICLVIGSYFAFTKDAKAQFNNRVVNPIVNLIGLTTTGTGVIPNSNLDIGASGQRVPNGYFTNLVVSSCTGCGGGGGGGADGNWVFFNNTGLRMTTTTNQVVIGASATSSLNKLDVIGKSYFSDLVGLGTTTPSAKLDVYNGANTNTGLYVEAGATGVNIAQFSRRASGVADVKIHASGSNPTVAFGQNTVDKYSLGYDGTNTGFVVVPTATITGALPNFIIKDTTGNVGIATSSPYSKLAVVGQVTADNFVATSTTATTTLSGNVLIGTNPSFGFNAGQPLVINTNVNGPAQMNVLNTNTGAFALSAYFLGNSKTTNAGYSAQYYAGLVLGGSGVSVPGFSELTPDTLALVNANGMVKIGSNSGNAASSSVAFYTLLGFNTPADMLLNGYGNLGLGTINANARLHVVGTSNATTSLALFETGTGVATTTRLIIQQNGMVGLSTTTASSTLDVYGSIAGRISLISATTTLDNSYYTVKATTTVNAVGVTLPPTTGACGRIYNVTKKNSAGFAVTITPSAGDTFGDGTSSKTITTQGLTYQLQADCSDRTWIILN